MAGTTDADGVAPAAPTALVITGLSYEQARDELVDVVRRLEAGGTTLEESLELWERAEALASVCEHWLDGARERLSAATAGRGSAQRGGEHPQLVERGPAGDHDGLAGGDQRE